MSKVAKLFVRSTCKKSENVTNNDIMEKQNVFEKLKKTKPSHAADLTAKSERTNDT